MGTRARGMMDASPSDKSLEPDDANVDVTYDRDLMGPDEVGSHPASVSPYGLFDVAGNAFEWTVADRDGTRHARWQLLPRRKTAALSQRDRRLAARATGGLRICATPR
jgi:hypothetical protein